MNRKVLKLRFVLAVGALVFLTAVAGCDGGASQAQDGVGPLRLGLLLNFSEGAPAKAKDRQRAFDLAVKHVNEGGGVFGRPVEVVVGDSTLDPARAVEAARRMVEVEGVHAIVGPSSSANSLMVVEKVTGPARIPIVSPSATSPILTALADNDFFFRTTLSDSAQGPVLAQVTREQGYDNVGLLYRDDAWGQGLFKAFQAAWTGQLLAVAVELGQDTYLPQLHETAKGGAQALVVITFETEAAQILREALEHGLYNQFTFGDALKSPDLAMAVGGGRLAGMRGTAGAGAGGLATPAATAWEAAFLAEYGSLPTFSYVQETYDATIALALAAQAAGSVNGAAIRDQLRRVGGGPGVTTLPGQQGVADALRILSEGGEVDYEGAAGSLDWDDNGDLRQGHIGIWRFTEDDQIEELGVTPFSQ